MRSMEPWLPPWRLNQSAKEMLSSERMSRMPPSGSISALTIGDVPRARLLANLSLTDSCGVVKNAFKPAISMMCDVQPAACLRLLISDHHT